MAAIFCAQVLPIQAGGTSLRAAFNHFAWGDDQVDAEAMPGLRQRAVDDLQLGCNAGTLT